MNMGEIDLLNLFSVQHQKLFNEAPLQCTTKPSSLKQTFCTFAIPIKF